jgi:hypothetical protein
LLWFAYNFIYGNRLEREHIDMKKNSLIIGLFAVLVSFAFGGQGSSLALGVPSAFAGAAKVTICHIPPGNPDNPQTLSVAAAAVAAHQSQHGDTLGACPAVSTCDCSVSLENVDDDRDASDNSDNMSNEASSNTAFSNTYSNQASDDNTVGDSTANVADDDNSDANDAQDNIDNVAAAVGGPICTCADGSSGVLVDPNPSAPTNIRGLRAK